jgi:hypothetical protein
MKVGDTVQVISPISPHYQEMGQVCNMTELGIEVKGDVTKVCAFIKSWRPLYNP